MTRNSRNLDREWASERRTCTEQQQEEEYSLFHSPEWYFGVTSLSLPLAFWEIYTPTEGIMWALIERTESHVISRRPFFYRSFSYFGPSLFFFLFCSFSGSELE